MNARAIPALTVAELAEFWSHVEQAEDCWIWKGTRVASAVSSVARHEYGVFRLRRGGSRFNLKAHRIAKALASEDHPEFDIDHTCQNKLCVNPDHLDWVTHEENRRRARQPVCQRGHSLEGNGRTNHGSCRQCGVDRKRAARAAQRALDGGSV